MQFLFQSSLFVLFLTFAVVLGAFVGYQYRDEISSRQAEASAKINQLEQAIALLISRATDSVAKAVGEIEGKADQSIAPPPPDPAINILAFPDDRPVAAGPAELPKASA